MSQLAPLNFSNFEPHLLVRHDLFNIGKLRIGTGVLEEIADAFGHELDATLNPDNLGELIGVVGSAKTLQDNIPTVQRKLGTSKEAVAIAKGWVRRSGLLLPVDRYYGVDELPEDYPDLYVITGGVRNWMNRRQNLLVRRGNKSTPVLLGAGNRKMSSAEGKDVQSDMTEADYISKVVMPKLEEKGFYPVSVLPVDSPDGNDVMRAVALEAKRMTGDPADKLIKVVSNAGAWVQNAGQFRRAMRETDLTIDEQAFNISVTAARFRLGSGIEPTTTHQNPFTALGQIARNFHELALQTSQS